MLDAVTLRTLGGLRVLDHMSQRPVSREVEVTSDTLVFARTLSGVIQIRSAPGFAAYAKAFDPVPAVPPQAFSFVVEGDARHFLPIASTITLPRDAGKDAVSNRVDSPLDVALPSAPGRPLTAGMTLVRASITQPGGAPVRGALVQVLAAGTSSELGWGLSARNGEVWVPMIGIPLLQTVDPGPDPDPDADEELSSANTPVRLRVTADTRQPWPANPDALRAGGPTIRSATDSEDINLTAGGQAHRALTLDLT